MASRPSPAPGKKEDPKKKGAKEEAKKAPPKEEPAPERSVAPLLAAAPAVPWYKRASFEKILSTAGVWSVKAVVYSAVAAATAVTVRTAWDLAHFASAAEEAAVREIDWNLSRLHNLREESEKYGIKGDMSDFQQGTFKIVLAQKNDELRLHQLQTFVGQTADSLRKASARLAKAREEELRERAERFARSRDTSPVSETAARHAARAERVIASK